MLKYNYKEVLRYLGYMGTNADDVTQNMIDEVYEELLDVINPKYIYKQFEILKTSDSVIINGVQFKSSNLLKNLNKANSVVLMGATLGKGADTLRKKYEYSNVAKSVIAQAVGASLIENLCDNVCEEIKSNVNGKLCPRFSPGYGDLDLSYQKDFFNLIDMNKMLGVTLSDAYMMTPTKTVTAFIGIKDGE